MADPKSIHEFTSGEGALGSLFLMDSPDQQASSGYTTEKLAMTDLGDFLNNEMEYTQDLNTEDKKISGALNELHGIDGFDVYDETTTSANKYVQGDICIHNNTLQVCTSETGAYGAWDSTKWSPTTIKALLALLNSGLSDTVSNIEYLRSRCYLGNYSTFVVTLPDVRQGGTGFNHKLIVVGYNAFAILNCDYSGATVSVVSLGSNTITATKLANSFDITVNLNDTSWGGIRVITLD